MKNYGLSSSFLFERTYIDGLYIISCNGNCVYDSDVFDICKRFVKDNESFSRKGVLRGLDIQLKYPQAKLIRVSSGCIFDVAVDLRKDSISYGKWFGTYLSADNGKMMYIPEGFAHGFYVVSESALVDFKVSEYWYPDSEICIDYNDSSLAIKWPFLDGEKLIVKDKHAVSLKEFEVLRDSL